MDMLPTQGPIMDNNTVPINTDTIHLAIEDVTLLNWHYIKITIHFAQEITFSVFIRHIW